MSAYGLVIFSLVYALAVATPGPGVALVIARALGRGSTGAAFFLAGFLAGDLISFTLAAPGLAMLAHSAHHVFLAVRYAGAAYLLLLAWRLWRSPAPGLRAAPAQEREPPWRLFLGSLALTLGNPKTMVFFLAILPTVIDLEHLTAAGFFAVAAVITLVLPAILGGYTLAAIRARRRLGGTRTVRWLQRGTGIVLVGAAVAVATR
jgi:threonine/homoserine/homoserine lactone efflux protein